MTTNVTKTGTSYNFNVTEGEYNFSGNCDKTINTLNINGGINYAVIANNNSFENNQYLGSFNYSCSVDGNVSFSINTNDPDDFDEIFAIIMTVIAAIKGEISNDEIGGENNNETPENE